MKMENIVVVYKSDNGDMGESLNMLRRAVDGAAECGGITNVRYIPRERLLEKDTRNAFIIVAGGDGTLLGAAHRILDNYSTVLGVRLSRNSRGYYTPIDVDSLLSFMGAVLEGKEGETYTVERLPRLECVMRTDEGNWVKTALALNEFFIGNTCAYYPAKYRIRCKGFNEWQRSSGLLVSTEHGFSGWAKWSCDLNARRNLMREWGGKGQKMFVKVREPMERCEHVSFMVDQGNNEKLEISSDMHRGMVVPDSFDEYHFNRGTKIEVRVSDSPLNVIRPINISTQKTI